jgi:hypothetical protein
MSNAQYLKEIAAVLKEARLELQQDLDFMDTQDRRRELNSVLHDIAEIKRHGAHLKNAASGAYQRYLLDSGYPKLMGRVKQLQYELNVEGH